MLHNGLYRVLSLIIDATRTDNSVIMITRCHAVYFVNIGAFFMRKSIISLVLSFGLALPAISDTLTIKPDAPQRYTVVPGDTLWGISGRYLKSPWQWPRLWHMNKAEVKNPHWIYPGDTLLLTYVNGQPVLSLDKGRMREVVLSPTIRSESLYKSVLTVPYDLIAPFIKRPLIVTEDEFKHSPELLAGPDSRVNLNIGDKAYASGIYESGTWQAYKISQPLKDPDTGEELGLEVHYGGDLAVDKLGDDIQSLHVVSMAEEIERGDHLIKAPPEAPLNYTPHPAAKAAKGKIIAVYDAVTGAAQYSNVIINKGERDGVDRGTVFDILRTGGMVSIKDKKGKKKEVQLPTEQVGQLLVYRVFPKVSYALIVESKEAIEIGNQIESPDRE